METPEADKSNNLLNLINSEYGKPYEIKFNFKVFFEVYLYLWLYNFLLGPFSSLIIRLFNKNHLFFSRNLGLWGFNNSLSYKYMLCYCLLIIQLIIFLWD